MNRRMLVSILTVIVGGGLESLSQALGKAIPGDDTIIINITAVVVACAGVILGIINAANTPATSIVADAPIVSATGAPTGAVNVSTTSTLPIEAPTRTAPMKGP